MIQPLTVTIGNSQPMLDLWWQRAFKSAVMTKETAGMIALEIPRP
jgi:hypothetical protein